MNINDTLISACYTMSLAEYRKDPEKFNYISNDYLARRIAQEIIEKKSMIMKHKGMNMVERTVSLFIHTREEFWSLVFEEAEKIAKGNCSTFEQFPTNDN